ncbi:MAG: outer membrane beta-barrel protein [Balneolaceae bacterium]
MKKLLTGVIALVLTTALGLSAESAEAQSQQGDIKAGVGLTYGSGVGFGSLSNDLGIRADGSYAFTPQIRGAADFTFYFPKSEGGVDMNFWELNFNAHYIFFAEEAVSAYGLGGINIFGFSQESQAGEFSDSEMGLNLGAGVEYGLNFGDLFGELKLGGLGGNADQFVIGFGVRFGL